VFSDLLDRGVRTGWTVSKTPGPKLVDKGSDGSNIKRVVQLGDGRPPRIVSDHCSTYSLQV
jgi:hypothetical protein